jgi:pyruvate/2-oxoacid:ferredoxin oxidoreductase beta subunit
VFSLLDNEKLVSSHWTLCPVRAVQGGDGYVCGSGMQESQDYIRRVDNVVIIIADTEM